MNCGCVQIKQPTLSTGIAMYTSSKCTLNNLILPTAAGFGIYGKIVLEVAILQV